jgi:type VI secretion system protein ImpK
LRTGNPPYGARAVVLDRVRWMTPQTLPPEAEAALRKFRQFYQELYAIKRQLADSDWGGVTGGRSIATGLPEALVRAVQQRLRRAIAAQGYGGPIAPGAPAGIDPGYVMAALADEALLHDVAWPGHDGWAELPLEDFLYRSRIAGDRIFQAVDILAARYTPDADGLAMTILLALEMGFRGRYHGVDDQGEIERVRLDLYQIVFRARPRESDGLVTGAAEKLAGANRVRLPPLQPWITATVAVGGGYLLLSLLLWWMQVSGVVASARGVATSLHGLL